jgi:hypothetical protein
MRLSTQADNRLRMQEVDGSGCTPPTQLIRPRPAPHMPYRSAPVPDRKESA